MWTWLVRGLLITPVFGYIPHYLQHLVERKIARDDNWPSQKHRSAATPLHVAYPSFHEQGSSDGPLTQPPTPSPIDDALEMIQSARLQIQQSLGDDDSALAVQQATALVDSIGTTMVPKLPMPGQEHICAALDAMLRRTIDALFSSKPLTKAKFLRGIDLIQLYNNKRFVEPYGSVPRDTLLQAISAISSVLEKRKNQYDPELTNAAFRLLQRLVAGHGVRHDGQDQFLPEVVFSKIMRSFCSGGRMDMAHRVAALQERTTHAPPLSAVSYSILIKGAGRWQGLHQVQSLVQHVQQQSVAADTVLWNTIMDAYVNCNALDQAQAAFRDMQRSPTQPNTRSYNTILKGLAEHRKLAEATAWADTMQQQGFWDAVSTNTLVHAAILAHDFARAEAILEQHTSKRQRRQHPNVEAYSELLDSYGKESRLADALRVLQTMQTRKVEPNEVTCACLLRWLGVYGKLALAQSFTKEYAPLTSKAYHAYIAGVMAYDQPEHIFQETGVGFDVRVRTALSILREMTTMDVMPTSPTIAILVDTLSKCSPPRTEEAKSFFNMLQQRGTIASDCTIVNTAFIKAYGNEGNITAAMEAFQQITQPDTIAVNAFLHACKKCNQDSVLVRTFHHHFDVLKLKPDVVSYSTIFSCLLKRYTVNTFRTTRSLYADMKRRKVKPDKAMVDTVLKSFLRPETVQQLRKVDIEFLSQVWQDAGSLNWEEEQLSRRQRSLRSVLANRVQSTFGGFGQLDVLFPLNSGSLFEKKGWNPVASGFQLWGNATIITEPTEVDSFLRSKGWNDVDSSFRLF